MLSLQDLFKLNRVPNNRQAPLQFIYILTLTIFFPWVAVRNDPKITHFISLHINPNHRMTAADGSPQTDAWLSHTNVPSNVGMHEHTDRTGPDLLINPPVHFSSLLIACRDDAQIIKDSISLSVTSDLPLWSELILWAIEEKHYHKFSTCVSTSAETEKQPWSGEALE